ncbi:MAG: type II secretion system F family protein [Phycisphaeraceae bacterium]|nr:MAG: type II secretion system F family protein [Phycisphaeraceae bacterium]
MNFRYEGFDARGETVKGTVSAPDARAAAEVLRQRGIISDTIEPAPAAARHADRGARIGETRRLRAIAAFARQLSILVETGTPMVDAIASIQTQSSDAAFAAVLADVRARMEEGASLSQAMDAHPRFFDPICRSLVEAGESGGCLHAMLLRLAHMSRQQSKVREGIASAMIYPALLTSIALAVLSVMIVFVLPRFEGLFKAVGAELPPTTSALIALSTFVREWWAAVLGTLIVGAFALRAWLVSAHGRAAVDRALIAAPRIGPLARALVTARVARVLGVLLEGKVTLLDALRLTGQAAGNDAYAALIVNAAERVTRGEAMSLALDDPRLIPPSVREAIRSGERSGRVGPVLLSIAAYLDEDNELAVRTLTSLIEPLILIVLGLVVGFVAFSMFLPLLDLTAATGGGGPA